MATPRKVPCHLNPQNLRMVPYFKKGFADVIKSFDMQSLWIARMHPKSNDKCPSGSEAESLGRREGGGRCIQAAI